ncbi:MAG: glycerol-3-phosphate 1-O-acyltransferase PlsY [Bacteroidota bacterium]|nr:glycerol-3-phosphate 1-O-acyltransferase PlsY [Bacteroidota bacterium]
MLYIILAIIAAYMLGSIPTSVWIGRLFFDVDVRDEGSRNAGATNTIRVLGWKAGIPVLIFDVFKGWLAVYLIRFLPSEVFQVLPLLWIRILAAAAAVAGHIYPVYIGFRGGKGVATLLGVGIALYPVAVWFVVLAFVVVLLTSGIVSLSSVLASIIFPLLVIFLFPPGHLALVILSIAVGLFVPLTHLSNIKRLIKGEEKKISIRKKKNVP